MLFGTELRLRFRRGGYAGIVGVLGAARCGPHRSEIDKLAFEALDLEPQRGAAGEGESHDAPWRIAFGEFDRQQIKYRLLVRAIHVPALEGMDALEPQCGMAALELRGVVKRAFPIEPGKHDNQPVLGWAPDDIANADNRVLEVGRNHGKIVLIQSDKLEEIHPLPPTPIFECYHA